MELDDFVQKVLIDLDRAVDGARKETNRDIHFQGTSESPTIQFDIAVSAEDASKHAGKAGVRVLSFTQAGGEISKESKYTTVSRVRFGITVDYLTKPEVREQSIAIESQNSNPLFI